MSGRTFVIVAAGSGSRLGGMPKQFRTLGTDPMWVWSARAAERLRAEGLIDEIVVVFPRTRLQRDAVPGVGSIKFADGGDVRTQSVLNGLRASSGDVVMIHDAARPFVQHDMCVRLIAETERVGAAVPVIPSVDSLKEIDGGDARIVQRDKIFRTQTPQCFKRDDLIDLLEGAESSTDEASLWMEARRPIAYVEGDERNFKITTDFDWQMATSLVAQSREIRTGYGYDVHELVPGRRLVLGGVVVPSPLGLLGHSDADIICHTAADAMLGAAGAGDIGTLFPASDARYKDADSTTILAESARIVQAAGWRVVWTDITLVAQIPRLASTMPKIVKNLSRVFTEIGIGDKLAVKVKSGERVGSVGRAECMICHAVATLERYMI